MSDGRLVWSSCGKQLCVCKWLKIWRKISLINYVMFHACGMPWFCIFPILLPIGCVSGTMNYWGSANRAGDISYLFLGGWGSMRPFFLSSSGEISPFGQFQITNAKNIRCYFEVYNLPFLFEEKFPKSFIRFQYSSQQ
jgi:hypothetical protein